MESDASTLSSTGDGRLLATSRGKTFSTIDIYETTAPLMRSVVLPTNFKNVRHVVETLSGTFCVLRQLQVSDPRDWGNRWRVSEMVFDDERLQVEMLRRFSPADPTQRLNDPQYLAINFDDSSVIPSTTRLFNWTPTSSGKRASSGRRVGKEVMMMIAVPRGGRIDCITTDARIS